MGTLLTLAWLIVIVYATIPAWWLLIHPFAERWRKWRRSPYRALLPLWILMWLIAGAATWRWRELRLYRSPLAWIPAALLLAISFFIYRRIRAEFGVANFSGQAEVRPHEFEQRLVTTGLHARVRHPIYLAHLCSVTAWTVGSGLAVNYALLLFALLTGAIMIRLEERELERRFGEEWREYKTKVLAVLPHLHSVNPQGRSSSSARNNLKIVPKGQDAV